jgi:hypothetical protein
MFAVNRLQQDLKNVVSSDSTNFYQRMFLRIPEFLPTNVLPNSRVSTWAMFPHLKKVEVVFPPLPFTGHTKNDETSSRPTNATNISRTTRTTTNNGGNPTGSAVKKNGREGIGERKAHRAVLNWD